MAFKINIGTKEGKTYKLEIDAQGLIGKSLGENIQGNELSPDLKGYEFQISGASDKSGFPALDSVEGQGTKKVLLSYEKGMKKHPKKEGTKKRSNYKPKGLKLRKTIRGKVISDAISQINLKPIKQGSKPLKDIFEKPAENPEQEKPSEEKK